MIRALRIAWRDYFAYVRTPGFWLSILLMPVGLGVFGSTTLLAGRISPPPVIAVADLTGQGYDQAIARAIAPAEGDDRPAATLAAPSGPPFRDAADVLSRLRPMLETTGPPGPSRLDAVVIVRPQGETVGLDLWSRNVADPSLGDVLRRAVGQRLRVIGLQKAGLPPERLAAIERLKPQMTSFSPKGGGKVSLRDKLPGLAGFAMGMLLWMVVLTGAGMLLNSVIEEKSSRILEVLLTSASVPEIMFGKILGVACVTGTVMGVWITVGAVALAAFQPALGADILAVLLAHGMLGYLALYFVGGYLMFATLYVTVGAFCETAREAQTLLGPMMIVLSIPVVFMSQAIMHPDAPLLSALAWVPIFTPFIMAARAAVDPPWWQVAGTTVIMFAVTGLELWVAVPAFKSGALSTGRFDIRVFFASLMRRETA
ncbi:MAG TPA: ABC transporter permease [Caulobacteraceae bacterium]|nr:ABC transporter permease [Caulobacteraceae bacterium]